MKKYLSILSALVFFGCAHTQSEGVKMSKTSVEAKFSGKYKITSVTDVASGEIYESTGTWGVQFENNHFGMFVGCNRIFGSVKYEKDRLIIIYPASTRMLCPNEIMKVEDLVNSALREFTISAPNILENDKVRLVLEEIKE